MGLGSILLGVFALVCMFAGFVLTFVPFLGTMLSFLAPVLAVAGIVLGGVAMSRAKEAGENDGTAIAGLVINVLVFLPAMLVAVTCGLCNTVCTGMMLTPHDPNQPSFWMRDGGGSSPFDQLFRDGGAGQPTPPGFGPVPNAPPPAFPPPPPVAPDPSAPPIDPAAAPPIDPAQQQLPTDPTQQQPPTDPTQQQQPIPQQPPGALPPPPLPAGPQQPQAPATDSLGAGGR